MHLAQLFHCNKGNEAQTAKLTRIHLTDYHATSPLFNVAVTKHQLNVSTGGGWAVFYSVQGELPVVSSA